MCYPSLSAVHSLLLLLLLLLLGLPEWCSDQGGQRLVRYFLICIDTVLIYDVSVSADYGCRSGLDDYSALELGDIVARLIGQNGVLH